jgi:hypothetical protein
MVSGYQKERLLILGNKPSKNKNVIDAYTKVMYDIKTKEMSKHVK